MSAYPIHHGQQDAASDARQWVPIDEAAQLLDRSEGNLRRVCDQLQHQGQAKKILVGGVHKWHIHTIYSPRLRRRAIETNADGSSKIHELLKTTTVAKLQRAQTDMQILIAFRRLRTHSACLTKDLPGFIESMKKQHDRCPGRTRLFEMDKLCPASEDTDGILCALIDRRGRPKGDAPSCSDAAWKAFCDLYLVKQQPSIAKCWRAVRALSEKHGWAWPSHSRVKQMVNEKLEPSMITLKREGQDAWNRKFLAPMEQDPNAWDVGQCWESDHSVLDLHCRVIRGDGWVRTRPHLTAWLDRRSRRLVGWQITPQGNELSIRAAMLSALKHEGISVPEIVWIDNGKDFMARSIGGMTKHQRRKTTRDEQAQAEQSSTGLLSMLGITPHFARHYNHDGKARIERFFGTVHGEFCKEFDSYSGFKPGMLDKLDHQATQRDVMNLPTLDEVRERFTEFASWYNHRSEHAIDDLRDPETLERLSPIEFYTRYLPAMRTLKRDKLVLLQDVWSNPLKVHKWGVSLRIDGNTIRYGEMRPELEPLVGSDQRVFVSYDPEDMGSVTIWTEKFELLCTAMQNGRYGGLATDKIKREDLKAGFDKRRQAKRRVKQKIDVVTGTLSSAELGSLAAREREVGATKARMREHDHTLDPNDLPPLRLVRTRLDDAPTDIEEQKYRMAVGAEDFGGGEEFPSIIEAARDLCLADDRQDEGEFDGVSLTDLHNAPARVEDDEFEGVSLTDFNQTTERVEDDEFDGVSILDHLP